MTNIGKTNKRQYKSYYGFLFLTSLVVLTSVFCMSMSSNSLIGNAWAMRSEIAPPGPGAPDAPNQHPKPVDPCQYASDDPACGQCPIYGCRFNGISGQSSGGNSGIMPEFGKAGWIDLIYKPTAL